MSDKVSVIEPKTPTLARKQTLEESLKEQSKRRKLANLKPFPKGHVSGGGQVVSLMRQIRSLTGDGLKIAQYWLDVMNDPDAAESMKMRASENLARCAWPALAPTPIEETNKASYQTVDAGSIDSALDEV